MLKPGNLPIDLGGGSFDNTPYNNSMAAEIENTVQSERLSTLFNANISHPEGDGLIFHPKVAFNSAEELVAHALASGSS